MPVRMALISLLLGLHKNVSLHKFESGFEKHPFPVYDQPIHSGIRCANSELHRARADGSAIRAQ